MRIKITLEEILDNEIWEEFCEMKGWDVYCINEGRADIKEEVSLTLEQAKKLGLIK